MNSETLPQKITLYTLQKALFRSVHEGTCHHKIYGLPKLY
jgi:hypothetical protein